MKELPQVGFSEAAQNFFKKCFQFKGRIRRSEYWWGALTVAIASAVLSLIPFVGWVALIFLTIGGTSMLFRRLHDTGRSGWWWGCQTIIGLVAGALFFSAIDFHAYMMAAQSQGSLCRHDRRCGYLRLAALSGQWSTGYCHLRLHTPRQQAGGQQVRGITQVCCRTD